MSASETDSAELLVHEIVSLFETIAQELEEAAERPIREDPEHPDLLKLQRAKPAATRGCELAKTLLPLINQ